MNENNEHLHETSSHQAIDADFHPVGADSVNQRPQRKKLPIIALALVFSMVGGLMGASGMIAGYYLFTDETSSTVLMGQRESTVIDVTYIDTAKEMTAAEVYAQNVNSTVGITTSITTNFWGYRTTSAASGSGFIITDDGYLLTNYHVVQNSDSIKATLYDGSSYEATLVGYDERNDLAVLKVDAEGLSPVVLGDSTNINVGDPVIAIGNPLGELTFSLTQGAISALDREITMSNGATMDLIQTDCAINSGNSGGALFNLHGEVVGITNAKYSGNGYGSEASIDNIGFAIPINTVQSIVKSIIENGYISKPYIGISVIGVSEEMQSYGLPKGAAVKEIAEGGPAENSGIQVNDIIITVNETAINDSDDLIDIVRAASAGDVLTLSVYRQGEQLTLSIEVGEQRQSAVPEENFQTTTPSNQGNYYQGMLPWPFGQ